MNKRDELKTAISTARRVHDRSDGPADGTCMILGALIQAVEILASDHLRNATKLIETPTSGTYSFPDELVERLERAYRKTGSPSIAVGIRAILYELAKMPVELPFDSTGHGSMLDAIIDAAMIRKPNESDRAVHAMTKDAMYALQMVHECLAPVLAAKDATIAEQAKRNVELEASAKKGWSERDYVQTRANENPTKALIMRIEAERDEARAQVADLKTKLGAAERSVEWHRQEMIAASIELGFPGSTIEEAARAKNKAHDADTMRITDLEHHAETLAVLADQYKAERDYGEETRRIQVERDGVFDSVGELLTRNTDLEKRLAEATQILVVDGKTPGQVSVEARRIATLHRGVAFSPGWDTFDGKTVDLDAIENEAANAVLRAFGDKAVLQRVRKAIYDIPFYDESRNRYPIQIVDDAAKIIDAELARLPASEQPANAIVAALKTVRDRIDSTCEEFEVSTSSADFATISKLSVLAIIDAEIAKPT